MSEPETTEPVKFPPARPEGMEDDEFQALGEQAWNSLSVDEKYAWAEGHDIRMLEIDGVLYDVPTRTPIPDAATP